MLAAVASVAALAVPLGDTEAAQAASPSDWDAGYIIDDAVFYDSNAMNATDIQAFLNAQVPTCTGNCLRNYGQPTGTIAPDAYCNGYQGAGYQTAAQIIDLVARSCGISQRALLVLLEKEQSLVTSKAPPDWAYRAATGMGCPDTAPCDPNVAGFFYQVYYGARQYQIYRLKPNSFNHRAGAWNNIRYSPDASCGTLRVFIYNQATAGLYNYTPYTPNAGSISNLYGTAPREPDGRQCGTYGNRNFWRIFTDWFGNPRRYVVHDGLAPYWNANGASAGPIGDPVSYAVYVEQNGQGWYQNFRGGSIYGSFWGGTVLVAANVIRSEYNRNGGPYGAMGWPNGEQYCASGSRCAQSFTGGLIGTTPQYGAHVIWGGFLTYWSSTGGLTGSLGAPLNDMTYLVVNGSPVWMQNFEAGVLVQSAGGFQVVPYSPILNTWIAAGGVSGWLGWPTSASECGASGCAQSFSGGVLASSPYGVQAISGGFIDEWKRRGGISGELGTAYGPLRYNATPTPGWSQNFAAGILTQSVGGFVLVPYGGIQAAWTASGEGKGSYGWPLGAPTCDASGCSQEFQGAILSQSSWGAYVTYGGIASVWKGSQGATAIGPAIAGIRYSAINGGGWAQHFAKGVITQSVTGSAVYTPYGPILNTWYAYGAEYTWLGWPTGAQTCSADGACVQQFQKGVARSNAAGAVSFTAS